MVLLVCVGPREVDGAAAVLGGRTGLVVGGLGDCVAREACVVVLDSGAEDGTTPESEQPASTEARAMPKRITVATRLRTGQRARFMESIFPLTSLAFS